MDEIITMNLLGKDMEILTGEMHKWVNEDNIIEDEYYIAIATHDSNIFLIQYNCIDGYDYNYIEHVVNGIPEFAKKYLINVMNNNSNLLVYISRYSNNDSCYDIYYDCGCKDITVSSLVNWMQFNNDFAATAYRYTEVKNGKQTIPQ